MMKLADQLEKCGLQELNLHVIQQKNNLAAATPAQDNQSEKSSLPPVVDASAQVSPNTAPDNDRIIYLLKKLRPSNAMYQNIYVFRILFWSLLEKVG